MVSAEKALKNIKDGDDLFWKICYSLGSPSQSMKEDPDLFEWLATGNYPLFEIDSDEEAMELAQFKIDTIYEIKESRRFMMGANIMAIMATAL